MKETGNASLTNMANSIAMRVFLAGNGGDSEYFFGTRSLKDDHGECFTSLWAFKAWDVLDKNPEANKAIIIDIGSGQIKRRLIERRVKGSNLFNTKELPDVDGYKFHDLLTTCFQKNGILEYHNICWEISNILTKDLANTTERYSGEDGEVFLHEKQIPIYAIGTAGLRKISDSDQEKMGVVLDALATESISIAVKSGELRDPRWTPVHLEILTPEKESDDERQAFLIAYEQATNIPNEARQYDIHGFLSWGNGSLQGSNEDGYSTKFQGGLRMIKEQIIQHQGEEKDVLNDKKYKVTFGGEQFDLIINSTSLWLVSQIKLEEERGNAFVGL